MEKESKQFTVKELQVPKTEEKIRRSAEENATLEEVYAAKVSQIDHLCGCKS